jgi:hypothetical protein
MLKNLTRKWMTGAKSSKFGTFRSMTNSASPDRYEGKNMSFTESNYRGMSSFSKH